eukprot:Selendium_serpulae@DN1994_c0_g1_i1.p1
MPFFNDVAPMMLGSNSSRRASLLKGGLDPRLRDILARHLCQSGRGASTALRAAFDAQSVAAESPLVGVLLVNIGSPTSPTYFGVVSYLRQFLSDRRVIRLPRLLWWPILYTFILPIRSFASAARYRRIWNWDSQHSATPSQSPPIARWASAAPLVRITQSVGAKVEQRVNETLRQCGAPSTREMGVAVEVGMQFKAPSVGAALRRLRERGAASEVVVVPLFPHRCEATTAAVLDAVYREVGSWSSTPSLRFVSGYAAHAAHAKAVAKSINDVWTKSGYRGEALVMSFHGMPVSSCQRGDPYLFDCLSTYHQVVSALSALEGDAPQSPKPAAATDWLRAAWQASLSTATRHAALRIEIGFQSRFGPTRWLAPNFLETLEGLARDGVRNVDVVCPGFATDCLETLDEVANEARDAFAHWCGELDAATASSSSRAGLRYIHCLNDSPPGVEVLTEVVMDNLPKLPPSTSPD